MRRSFAAVPGEDARRTDHGRKRSKQRSSGSSGASADSKAGAKEGAVREIFDATKSKYAMSATENAKYGLPQYLVNRQNEDFGPNELENPEDVKAMSKQEVSRLAA